MARVLLDQSVEIPPSLFQVLKRLALVAVAPEVVQGRCLQVILETFAGCGLDGVNRLVNLSS